MLLTSGVTISGGYISGYVAAPLATSTLSSPATTDFGPINAYFWRSMYKVIYTAAELNSAGLSGSTVLTGLMLRVTNVPSPVTPSVTIGMTNTASAVGSDITTGWTTVFSAAYPETPTLNSVTNPVYGLKFSFSTPFTWNGTSNLGIGFAETSRGTFTSTGTVETAAGNGTARGIRSDSAGAYLLTEAASSSVTGRAIIYLTRT